MVCDKLVFVDSIIAMKLRQSILSVFLLIIKTIFFLVSKVEKVSKTWEKENCAVKLIMDSDAHLDTSSIDTLPIVRYRLCKLFKFCYILLNDE